jgi:cyclic pyranopterin phosphate synthase
MHSAQADRRAPDDGARLHHTNEQEILHTCLGQEDAIDLKAAVRRSSHDDGELMQAIATAIRHKPRGHDFVIGRGGAAPALARHMSATGG